MMSRTFYFFFSCTISCITICNSTFAAETSQGSSIEEKSQRRNVTSPKTKSQPKPNTHPSLKEYLQSTERSQIEDVNEAEHTRRATQLTLEDEGMLPPANTGIYTE